MGWVYLDDESILLGLCPCLEQMNVAIVVTDKDGKLEWFNRAFHKMCGHNLRDLKGTKLGHALQGKDSDPQVIEHIRQCIKDRVSCSVELVNYHKDGHPYWAEIHISPVFNESGKLVRFIAFEREITKEKHRQDEKDRLSFELYQILLDSVAGKENQEGYIMERTRQTLEVLSRSEEQLKMRIANGYSLDEDCLSNGRE